MSRVDQAPNIPSVASENTSDLQATALVSSPVPSSTVGKKVNHTGLPEREVAVGQSENTDATEGLIEDGYQLINKATAIAAMIDIPEITKKQPTESKSFFDALLNLLKKLTNSLKLQTSPSQSDQIDNDWDTISSQEYDDTRLRDIFEQIESGSRPDIQKLTTEQLGKLKGMLLRKLIGSPDMSQQLRAKFKEALDEVMIQEVTKLVQDGASLTAINLSEDLLYISKFPLPKLEKLERQIESLQLSGQQETRQTVLTRIAVSKASQMIQNGQLTEAFRIIQGFNTEHLEIFNQKTSDMPANAQQAASLMIDIIKSDSNSTEENTITLSNKISNFLATSKFPPDQLQSLAGYLCFELIAKGRNLRASLPFIKHLSPEGLSDLYNKVGDVVSQSQILDIKRFFSGVRGIINIEKNIKLSKTYYDNDLPIQTTRIIAQLLSDTRLSEIEKDYFNNALGEAAYNAALKQDDDKPFKNVFSFLTLPQLDRLATYFASRLQGIAPEQGLRSDQVTALENALSDINVQRTFLAIISGEGKEEYLSRLQELSLQQLEELKEKLKDAQIDAQIDAQEDAEVDAEVEDNTEQLQRIENALQETKTTHDAEETFQKILNNEYDWYNITDDYPKIEDDQSTLSLLKTKIQNYFSKLGLSIEYPQGFNELQLRLVNILLHINGRIDG